MDKMREQLLTEFMPDDACPLGTRFLEDTQKTYQVDSGDVKPQKVIISSSASHNFPRKNLR